jgi:hypothetical protein
MLNEGRTQGKDSRQNARPSTKIADCRSASLDGFEDGGFLLGGVRAGAGHGRERLRLG